MGDLRNKFAKQAWRDAVQKRQANARPKFPRTTEKPLKCWCGATEDLIASYGRYQVHVTCRAHEPVFCQCLELATRVEGGKPVCEDCWERNLYLEGKIGR